MSALESSPEPDFSFAKEFAKMDAVRELAGSTGNMVEQLICFPPFDESSPNLTKPYTRRLKALQATTSGVLDELPSGDRQLVISMLEPWESVGILATCIEAGYDHYFLLQPSSKKSPIDCAEFLISQAAPIHDAKAKLKGDSPPDWRGLVVSMGSGMSPELLSRLPSAEALVARDIDRVMVLHSGNAVTTTEIRGKITKDTGRYARGQNGLPDIINTYRQSAINLRVLGLDLPPTVSRVQAVGNRAVASSTPPPGGADRYVRSAEEIRTDKAWEEINQQFPKLKKPSAAANIALELHMKPGTDHDFFLKYFTFLSIYGSIENQLEGKKQGQPSVSYEAMVSLAVSANIKDIQSYKGPPLSPGLKEELIVLAQRTGLAFIGEKAFHFWEYEKD